MEYAATWIAQRPGLRPRFAVLETDDPLAGYTDKLDERFVGEQQSS